MTLQKLSYKRDIWFMFESITHFCYWSLLHCKSEQQLLSALFQCFVKDETMSMTIRWLKISFLPSINVQTKLMKVDNQSYSTPIQCWCVCWERMNPISMTQFRTNSYSRKFIRKIGRMSQRHCNVFVSNVFMQRLQNVVL